jgi:hypothetical protein
MVSGVAGLPATPVDEQSVPAQAIVRERGASSRLQTLKGLLSRGSFKTVTGV